MKVLLRYIPQDDEDEELETSFSLTLPKAWLNGPTEKLRHLFCDNFNKKHVESGVLAMDKQDSRLETKTGQMIADDAVIEQVLKDGDEIFLKRGKTGNTIKIVVATPTAATPSALPTTTTSSDTLPCKRFGCGKRFSPGQADQGPCRHHKKPPVFHETRKYWACCPDKVAWDWDSFQAIQGCEELPEHSNEAAAKKFMGGTELRAEINGPREIERKATGLDKLMQLRQALVGLGVSGDVFDHARDGIKRLHEEKEGKQVWDKVCSEMVPLFEQALNKGGESTG